MIDLINKGKEVLVVLSNGAVNAKQIAEISAYVQESLLALDTSAVPEVKATEVKAKVKK